ncbi:MAG: protease modulator HflC [Bacteroidales bacterium]|nr:protease modulator HflC [Bacteroidales bacterium]
MNSKKTVLIIIIVVVGLILGFQSAYVINETQQVVITQFGKPVGEAITTPGLKLKTPFIQKANYFEKRYMEWDGEPNQVPTKEKKFIFVDTYARWQITDPLQFFKRLTNERGAQSRLDDILDGETRNYIASHVLEEAVRSSNRQPEDVDSLLGSKNDTLSNITVGRENIQAMILKSANEKAEDLGVVILDFRFKRINYVPDVREEVYKRMRSERIQIANKFRSEGHGAASRINGEKERELKTIQSEAYKNAEEIKGRADARAASIYASAYDQTAASRGFYAFLKSMETFKNTFDTSTSVVLSTDSELYRYLKTMK